MRKQTNKYSRLSQYGPNSKCHALMFRGKTGKHLMVKNHSNSSVISPALSRKAQIPPRPCSPGKISFPLTYHTAPDLKTPPHNELALPYPLLLQKTQPPLPCLHRFLSLLCVSLTTSASLLPSPSISSRRVWPPESHGPDCSPALGVPGYLGGILGLIPFAIPGLQECWLGGFRRSCGLGGWNFYTIYSTSWGHVFTEGPWALVNMSLRFYA